MSVHNLAYELAESRLAITTKTATATLTADEIKGGPIKANHASTPIALTLPAANECAGYEQIIYDYGAAALTVVASDGFGGAGAGSDTLTLAQGEYCKVWSDGAQWFCLHNEPAA